jgi:hypothetical protein
MARRWMGYSLLLVCEIASVYLVYRYTDYNVMRAITGKRMISASVVVGQPIALVALVWIFAQTIEDMTSCRVSAVLAFIASCVIGSGLVILDHL